MKHAESALQMTIFCDFFFNAETGTEKMYFMLYYVKHIIYDI